MFDLAALSAAVARHNRVARVVVAAHDGSSPREVGAAMLVWTGGTSGTIGGGALEWEAIAQARALLPVGGLRFDRAPLGPKLGQCCGGAVSLLTEVHDRGSLRELEGRTIIARPVTAGAGMPLGVRRMLAQARAEGRMPDPGLVQGWMVEPVAQVERPLWLWGAGHVGRALAGVLAPLPGIGITWIDTGESRFPEAMPIGVTPLWARHPQDLVPHAPAGAEHLIVTYSHALDLELCHRLLLRGNFGFIGLIGSTTKWARFRSRLAALGHGAASTARITCPIGDVTLGKHPQAIAVGVAVDFLKRRHSETEITDDNGERGPPLDRGADESLSGGGRQ